MFFGDCATGQAVRGAEKKVLSWLGALHIFQCGIVLAVWLLLFLLDVGRPLQLSCYVVDVNLRGHVLEQLGNHQRMEQKKREGQWNEVAWTSSRSFNMLRILALCVKRCLELLNDAEFEQNDSAVGQLNAT